MFPHYPSKIYIAYALYFIQLMVGLFFRLYYCLALQFSILFNHVPSLCSLEVVLRNKQGDFSYVSPNLDPSLELTHLHFCLHRGRTLNWSHQHQLTCQSVWTLDGEVAAGLLSAQQRETKGVTHLPQRWDSEHDSRGWQVGHHSHVMVGEGVRGLRTSFVLHRAGVTFTAPEKITQIE